MKSSFLKFLPHAATVQRWTGNVVIILIALVFYTFIFYNFFEDQITTARFREPVEPLVALPVCSSKDMPDVTDKTVVLRVDDIQANIWRETQLKIIHDTALRGIPLSLGVIPSEINSDRIIVNALRTYSCVHEVALHGYDHGRSINHIAPEFASTTKAEATDRIVRGLTELNATGLPTPLTWIPPRNNHSTGTIEALGELGFQILSTEGTSYYDYDTSVTNYDFGSLVPPEDIVAKCKETFVGEQKCIIMIHPQDFVNGPDHNQRLYEEYFVELLNQLEDEGVSFARFIDIHAAKE